MLGVQARAPEVGDGVKVLFDNGREAETVFWFYPPPRLAVAVTGRRRMNTPNKHEA